MYIRSINLTNFRCYNQKKLLFDSGINILVGNNATGKTTIVEAIYSLATTKSLRTNNENEIIKHSFDFAISKGVFCDESKQYDVLLAITEKGKKLKFNGKVVNSLSSYIGFINIVVFSPDDLQIIKGGPINRRKFLDVCISQVDKMYLNCLINYKKLLKQRNELLKSIADKKISNDNLLEVINDDLIGFAKAIILRRRSFINKINSFIKEIGYYISDKTEKIEIIYCPNCEEDNISQLFEEKKQFDISQRFTSVGPHRDDFNIIVNNKDLNKYGSQGQIRTVALSLKLAFSEMLKTLKKSNIVILDDVFSELDASRQNKLIKMFKNDTQIFITTTSINDIYDDIKIRSNIININKEGE